MVRGSASRSCHSHDNRAKSARITEEVRGPHPSRIAKALGIPHIAAFGNLQLVAEESFRTNDSWAWGSMDLWARVDQLSTSVAGITSWQMHGYGKKNTRMKLNLIWKWKWSEIRIWRPKGPVPILIQKCCSILRPAMFAFLFSFESGS